MSDGGRIQTPRSPTGRDTAGQVNTPTLQNQGSRHPKTMFHMGSPTPSPAAPYLPDRIITRYLVIYAFRHHHWGSSSLVASLLAGNGTGAGRLGQDGSDTGALGFPLALVATVRAFLIFFSGVWASY